jgi:nitrite reductase/ring-hydroxylating ferredoxin subunit
MSPSKNNVRTYLCASHSLKQGGIGVRFKVHAGGEVLPAFVVRHRDGVAAFINRCGHRDLELDWSLGEFFDLESRWLICATHGAHYDPKTGACQSGPCNGVGLTVLAIIEEAGGIYLADPCYHTQSLGIETNP